MLYLMVGGPWHGKWNQLDPETVNSNRHYLRVLNPPKPLVYERAPEFGVPATDTSWYTKRRFDVFSPSADGSCYLDVLVWVGPLVDLAGMVADAFQAACDERYVPYYQWSVT